MLVLTSISVSANNPPTVEIIEPKDGWTVSGTVMIWMLANDIDSINQIDSVRVMIDFYPPQDATLNGTDIEGQWWNYSWDTTEWDDGPHQIEAIAWDGFEYGNHTIEVIVDNLPDNIPPEIWIVEPGDGDTLSGLATVWMLALDDDGLDKIKDAWIRIDDGGRKKATFDRVDSEGSWWYHAWDSAEVGDGWHTITATAYDEIDVGSDEIEIFIDNIPEPKPPQTEILEPDNGEPVSGQITILICAWDPDGNPQIQNVWIRIDSGQLRNAVHDHTDAECSWWFYEWETLEVGDGLYPITAIAYDGSQDGYSTIEILVDNVNSPPEIWIDRPMEGEGVSGVYTITGTASDPDADDQVEQIWIRIGNDGILHPAADTSGDGSWATWEYEWDTAELESDDYLVTAIVFDGKILGDDNRNVVVGSPDELDNALAPNQDLGYLYITVAIIGLMSAFSVASGSEIGKYALLKIMFIPLYTRLRKKDILDHFIRGEIYGYIKVNPGDNYSTIKRNLDLNNGTLTYHLNVLEREGLIKSWNQGGHKYFYPKGVKIPDDGVKNPSIRDAIMKNVEDSPGISIKDIAAVTGISRQLANYHVRKMAAEGKILLERRSFSKACYPPPIPQNT